MMSGNGSNSSSSSNAEGGSSAGNANPDQNDNKPESHNAGDKRSYSRIAAQTGLTKNQVRDALHKAKNENGVPGNRNVNVDDNGNMSYDGESLGNIHDYVNSKSGQKGSTHGRGSRKKW